MSEPAAITDTAPASGGPTHQYVVVARRYRPQTFDELLGQEHVAQALSNAIATHRVGHAYLFTGARGVGKTSAARILAKALNCEHGPAVAPCNECDICRGISSGDDVDVLEIDGASNRGIDEIRQLRQNVNVRPSRARFKIYIIDEVHMLTREAFNALLKTLEEPPEHVKFIFCTTEATKIPITILSRCQRFDFAGISTRSIHDRLGQIVQAEGVEAEPEALEVIARRAAGSMRDSQSLLEQLLAFAPERITVADVHGMLGTAGDQRLTAIVQHMVSRNAAAALAELDGAVNEGVDVGQLLEQLLGYFRDCMMAAVGCPTDSFLYSSVSSSNQVAEAGKQMGLQTVLAAMQITDQALGRMKYSTQGRILAELAVVRLCHLEELDELAALIAQLQSGLPPATTRAVAPAQSPAAYSPARAAPPAAPAAPSKKNFESTTVTSAAAPDAVASGGPVLALDSGNAAEIWSLALGRLTGMVVEQAKRFHRVEFVAPNRLVVSFRPEYTMAKSACQRAEQASRFEKALAEVTGQRVVLEFVLVEATAAEAETAKRPLPPHQRLLEVAKHPMIRRAGELFGAQPLRVEEPSD
jgi:DNA polymerase-3 subunit gamma/tau